MESRSGRSGSKGIMTYRRFPGWYWCWKLGLCFLPTCEVMRMLSATHSTPTSSMAKSSTVISAGIVSSSIGIIGATSPMSAIPNPTENSSSKEPKSATPHTRDKERETTSNTTSTSAKAPDRTLREPEHHHISSLPPLPLPLPLQHLWIPSNAPSFALRPSPRGVNSPRNLLQNLTQAC